MARLLYFLLLPLLIIILAQSEQYGNALTSSSSENPARILLLTAHPDDECMFFAPTILSLAKTSQVYSLCLSIGDADSLGDRRRVELQKSLDILGIGGERRWVIDSPHLRDNFTAPWSAATIAEVVKPYILQHKITAVLTFDHGGISGHPNHLSLPQGLLHLISSEPSFAQHTRIYTLISLPTIAKYTGPIAPLLAKLDLRIGNLVSRALPQALNVLSVGLNLSLYSVSEKTESLAMPVFVSGVREYAMAFKAMLAHESQLVWFRWLYLLFSRYMWVNEWVEINAI